MKQFSAIGNWLTRLVFYKNDNPELIIRKKFFLIANLIAILLLSCLLALSHILDLKNFGSYLFMLLICNLAQSLLLVIIRKWSKWFIYSMFSLYVVLIFYIIIRLGGLANSAGLLMAAYFFLLTSQWMQDTKLLLLTGALFVVGVLVAGISYPYLTVDSNLSGWKNNLFFAINFGWIGLLLAVALYSTIVKSENAAKNRAEQLQQLGALKSKLYANIAHEFRPPLTLIKGNAAEIGEHHAGETVDRTNRIIQNADKILFLVNQMLDLSIIEEGGVPVRYVQGDLIVFIRFVVDSFQGYADSRKIGLHYQALCPRLMMDIEAEKLEASLSNLLSNAIKYTPEGGNVYVTVRLAAGTNKPEQQVEISVRDTGIGIPADQLDKIFIRFYRVEDKHYPYQEGTGIGLTLVSEYLKLMNGTIRVTSNPGAGSEFVVTLPVTQNAEPGEVVLRKDAPVLGEKAPLPQTEKKIPLPNLPRLLIIEDNRELTGYLAGLLDSKYQLLTAENGILGTQKAIAHIPDIILSDVMMPGKDGYQVCTELKNDFRTNHIPIVLLTARADTDSRITGYEHGADAYLTKPFDKKELMACLHNLFLQREILRIKFRSALFDKLADEKNTELNGRFLGRVTGCLERNYKNDRYGIASLYSDMGISRVQLHRKLTALTGQSASNFIRSFRLQKARKLLLETDRNVSDIAYEVGFADANYFTKAFTLEYGLTASELRKSFC